MNSKFLVALQFLTIFIIIIPKKSFELFSSWWILLLISTLLALWIFLHNRIGNFNIVPDIKDGAKLVTTGPYRFIRHPMYFSLILFMSGVVLHNFCLVNVVALLVMIVAVIFKAIKEERLWSCYDREYKEYCQKSKMIIPFLF
jgi:protein-S-isoprenylcysteine O-methyltransferase Ste14